MKPFSAFAYQGSKYQTKCPACDGSGAWFSYDKQCYSYSKIAVCPLCRGAGIEPDYPEPFPSRPPSHYLNRYRDKNEHGFWCANSSFCASQGHMPVTAMVEVLKALVKHGDVWQKLTVDQVLDCSSYFRDNRKHGEFHVKAVLPWTHESRRIATFAAEWREVFYWEDSEGIRLKVAALNQRNSRPSVALP